MIDGCPPGVTFDEFVAYHKDIDKRVEAAGGYDKLKPANWFQDIRKRLGLSYTFVIPSWEELGGKPES